MADPPDILDLIGDLRRQGAPFCVATVIRTQDATAAKAGAKAVIRADGTVEGFLGGGCVLGAARKAAAEALASGQPQLIRVQPKDRVIAAFDADGVALHKSGCPSGGSVDLFLEPMQPPPLLLVCGGSAVAVAAADLGRRLGYRVVVSAPEADLERFDPIHARLPAYRLEGLALADGFAVIATQGSRDQEALRAVLEARPAYAGFVSSRRKATVLRERLLAAGLEDSLLAPLRAPAGLSIQAVQAEEIALSILAEIISLRRAAARNPAVDATETAA